LTGLVAVALIAFMLYRNNRKERAHSEEISRTLDNLRITQAQLVQSEKMASLGELTAGIAHEIQNPLNFVNNFSEINQELIDDLQQAVQQGDMREVSQIAESLKENEAKINLHGKRADAIVKSMLQHSRGSSGQKERADVNKMVDEYVRLAFHGYRAKSKEMNVDLDIDLDPQAGTLDIVKQDIGRVLLNLLNNAFYATLQRKDEPGYKPRVSIRTRRTINVVAIEVEDNGPGIPSDKKEKIFQPFFTTKPTGQGTGLGLSLSYDIVTKGHGGNLQCESREGEGALFRVSLPIA
jgi:signal transduction histidine kinase